MEWKLGCGLHGGELWIRALRMMGEGAKELRGGWCLDEGSRSCCPTCPSPSLLLPTTLWSLRCPLWSRFSVELTLSTRPHIRPPPPAPGAVDAGSSSSSSSGAIEITGQRSPVHLSVPLPVIPRSLSTPSPVTAAAHFPSPLDKEHYGIAFALTLRIRTSFLQHLFPSSRRKWLLARYIVSPFISWENFFCKWCFFLAGIKC